MTQRLKLVVVVAMALSTTMFEQSASAACIAKNSVSTNSEIQVVVPFAVPVAVPVATLAPYFYSYQQTKSGIPGNSEQPAESPAASVAGKTEQLSIASAGHAGNQSILPTTNVISAVALHCATCHGGQFPKAGLSLEHVEALNNVDRLRAIRAVVNGQMPKGAVLNPEEIRAVVANLTNAPAPQHESATSKPVQDETGN